jgi:hypothetical protein
MQNSCFQPALKNAHIVFINNIPLPKENRVGKNYIQRRLDFMEAELVCTEY